MSILDQRLSIAFCSKQVVKVIVGLNNFNIKQIVQIVKSSEIAGAHYVDIPANPQILSFIKSITDLPICVSSIDPIELYNCVKLGADLVEIGNFDVFYDKKIYFSSSDILSMAIETLSLIKDKDISVTIPSTLSLNEQVILAKQLENLGIQILQTEGFKSYNNIQNNIVNSDFSCDIILNDIYQTYSTLCSTYVISQVVSIPVIASSGVSILSSSIAKSYGASGVGVGSSVKAIRNIYEMTTYISELCNCIKKQNSLHNINGLSVYETSRKNIVLI